MRRKEIGDERGTGRGEDAKRNERHGTSGIELLEDGCADVRRACIEDWKCEDRGAYVDTGEKHGRGQAEDLSGTDGVVHWM